MQLLTDELKQTLTEAWDLCAKAVWEDDSYDPPIHAHFSHMRGIDYYVTSGKPNGDDWILFAWAQTPEGEWEHGSVSLADLDSVRFERDKFWTPILVSELLEVQS